MIPALVYGYELFGSVKEITALALILTMGELVVRAPQLARAGPARRGIPLAIVARRGGISALGVAFGAWALCAVAVLAVDPRAQRLRERACGERCACARGRRRARAVAALPTLDPAAAAR